MFDADQIGMIRRAENPHGIRGVQHNALLSVDGQKSGISAAAYVPEFQGGIPAENNGAIVHGLGTDGRGADAVEARIQNRAARRHGIGGGSGRRRQNHTVGVAVLHQFPVAVQSEGKQFWQRAVGKDDIVECGGIHAEDRILPKNLHIQHDAPLDDSLPRHDGVQKIGFVAFDLRQISQPAAVDARNGDLPAHAAARRPDDGAIPAEDQDQIGLFV